MDRSDVNQIIRDSDAFIRKHGFALPPFAYWTPEEMKTRVKSDSGVIYANRMGWDITDYGQENFDELGLFLFTTRNGEAANLIKGMGMLYAEKIMISRKNQVAPLHRHVFKTEDIINRGGGKLVIELFAASSDGGIDRDSDVHVSTDGRLRVLKAGTHLALSPGESVTLMPGDWHAFWGEGADTLIGEVSTVNDDLTDNIFFDPVGRFSKITENESPLHLLVADYDTWLA